MKQSEIVDIPIAEIRVSNPRTRNHAKWLEIVASIRVVGLKRPITVSRRREATSEGERFDLVCGQGRIEALSELGETKIPAIVKEVSREDQFLMSLVENLARRPPPGFSPISRCISGKILSLRSRIQLCTQEAAAVDLSKCSGWRSSPDQGIVNYV